MERQWTTVVTSPTLCMLVYFECFYVDSRPDLFKKLTFFQKVLSGIGSEHHQTVWIQMRLNSRSYQQKILTGKELGADDLDGFIQARLSKIQGLFKDF